MYIKRKMLSFIEEIGFPGGSACEESTGAVQVL